MKNPVLDEYTVLTACVGEVYDVHDAKNNVYEPVMIEGTVMGGDPAIYITRVRRMNEAEKDAQTARDGGNPFDYDWMHLRPTEGLLKRVAVLTRQQFAEILASGKYELD
jgi:hypothetical protein